MKRSRAALLALLPVLLLPALLPVALGAATEARAVLEANLALERRLLVRDLAAHAAARQQGARLRGQAEEVAGRMDDLLATTPTPAAFDRLEVELANARSAARVAEERADEARRRVGEHLRRIAALQEELGAGSRVPDPLSGRWRVRLLPQNVSGVFDFTLDGTLVTGKYTIEGGPAGSFRGTYVDNAVRLERVDARTGFDSTFLGAVDPFAGRINGTWHANELAAGQPASGQWSAVRLPPTRP